MSDSTIKSPHTQSSEEILSTQSVDPSTGLTSEDAVARLQSSGRNELKEEKPISVWRLVLAQFETVVVYILGAAMVLAFATGRFPEGWALLAVILINTIIGFISEWRAHESMAALKAMGQTERLSVLRDGKIQEIAIETVVPGDILEIQPEDVIPADARIIETDGLRVSEAALTGESVAVNKLTSPLNEDTPLAERFCMVFKGTTVAEGSGKAVVTATGTKTELGHISKLASGERSGESPLQKQLDRLGARLAYLSLGLAVIIGGVGLISGRDLVTMAETAIALGVAMVPEGLPIVATIALARGMWLLAQRNAIINRLTAVETLGATQVICTDKTGTLTHNRMVMRRVITPTNSANLIEEDGHASFAPSNGQDIKLPAHAIRLGVLCNNAVLKDEENEGDRGDPTEIALLEAGRHLGTTRSELLEKYPEVREVDFDSDVMMMATFHQRHENGDYLVAVKGAPDRVLDACTHIANGSKDGEALENKARADWEKQGEELAADGFRVLAVADKIVSDQEAEPFDDLRMVGFLALDDPPRLDVRDSIEACHRAGIEVVMVTGDQRATARAIGRETAIVEDGDDGDAHEGRELEEVAEDTAEKLRNATLFARVSPEQKLNLVKMLQDDGKIVAMTGDGVNDTPALKRADIGIAMGERGTDAAKQAADMVLKDDKFSTILKAIELGRIIFGNIRKSVTFMLCTNLAEIIAVGIAATINSPLPLLPLQILYLNVLTDVFPALALGVGRGNHQALEDPPRPKGEGLLTKREWKTIATWSVVLSTVVLGALFLALNWAGLDERAAITVSFLTLGFGKLLFVFNLREAKSGFFRNAIVENRWIWGAIALCSVLLLAAVHIPFLRNLLHTNSPGPIGWLLVAILSSIPLVIGQVWLAIKSRKV